MPNILTDKIVTTRKAHKCHGCAREFPAGSKLQLIEQVDGDGFFRSYWCPVCQTVWNEEDYWEDIGFGELKQDEAWEETRKRLEAL